MADYTAKRIDDMEATFGGGFHLARAELGVSSFGMQVMDFPQGFDSYPEHDHSDDGQEEVYVALSGSAQMEIDGDKVTLDPSTMVRVPAGTRRSITTPDGPARILAIGGVPGKAYDPPQFTEPGAPESTTG